MSKTMKLVAAVLIVLILLLATTRPTELPTAMLIMPFLLIFLCLALTIRFVFKKFGITDRQNFGLAALIASLPVVALAMQSLGQLTVRDFAMLVALFAITYFYIYRTARSSN